MLAAVDLHCPYCGEPITVFADTSAGGYVTIEDCQVCCRPITLIVSLDDDGDATVAAFAENDA